MWTTLSPDRVIRHNELKATDAAPCTFRQEGREPDLRCGCEPRMLNRSEPTFKLALIRVCLCSAEGSTEPSGPDDAQCMNVGNSTPLLVFRLKIFARQQRRCANHKRATNLVHQAEGKPLKRRGRSYSEPSPDQ
jgi:hypothetical protein